MKKFYLAFVGLVLACSSLQAQVEFSAGADLVNNYVWRGDNQWQAGAFQPSLGVSYQGFSLGVWGSTSIANPDPSEFDITLGYGIGGFSIALTDYYWAGNSERYSVYDTNHLYEAAVSYSFGESLPLTLSWATFFAGADKKINDEGKEEQNYSTYISAAYDFKVGDVDLTASLGVSPWTSVAFSGAKEDFHVTDLSLKASKSLKITESFSLPVFAQAILAPSNEAAYLVFGISF